MKAGKAKGRRGPSPKKSLSSADGEGKGKGDTCEEVYKRRSANSKGGKRRNEEAPSGAPTFVF